MKRVALITSLIVAFCLTLGSLVLADETKTQKKSMTKPAHIVNITIEKSVSNIQGMNITNLNPNQLDLNALSNQDYILITDKLVNDEKTLNILKNLLQQGKHIYIYGENLSPLKIIDQLGIATVKIDAGTNFGQAQIFGIKPLEPDNNVYYIDLYWTEKTKDTAYLLHSIGSMLNNAASKTQTSLPESSKGTDSYALKGISSFTWDYQPYGKLNEVAQVYKQTNDGSDIKDWWYIHHFYQPMCGKYIWDNTWRNRYLYVKDQPGSIGQQTNLISFSPNDPPAKGAFSVSLPTENTQSFCTNQFRFGLHQGGIGENYVQWVAKPCILQCCMPSGMAVEPKCKFETPQNGAFYNKGHHTMIFTEEALLMDQTKTNYLFMQYSS